MGFSTSGILLTICVICVMSTAKCSCFKNAVLRLFAQNLIKFQAAKTCIAFVIMSFVEFVCFLWSILEIIEKLFSEE